LAQKFTAFLARQPMKNAKVSGTAIDCSVVSAINSADCTQQPKYWPVIRVAGFV
jgi:hypothetical protein